MMSIALMACNQDDESTNTMRNEINNGNEAEVADSKPQVGKLQSVYSPFDILLWETDITSIDNIDSANFSVDISGVESYVASIIDMNENRIITSISGSENSWTLTISDSHGFMIYDSIADAQSDLSPSTTYLSSLSEPAKVALSVSLHYKLNGDSAFEPEEPDNDFEPGIWLSCFATHRSWCEDCGNYSSYCNGNPCSTVTADCICALGDFGCICLSNVSC